MLHVDCKSTNTGIICTVANGKVNRKFTIVLVLDYIKSLLG